MSELHPSLQPLFWDYDFAALTWQSDGDLIIARVLAAGDWGAVSWLRSQLGDAALRRWLLQHRGTGLSPRQLRFWQLVLRLPRRQVDAWLQDEGRLAWDRRARP